MAKQLAHKPDQFQQQAIDSTARGIRIVAPAGSGKSETLARRVAKRIEQDGIDPRRILVLTFDNAAKKSLNDFLSHMLDHRQLPPIRTFNGHGLQVLKEYFPDDNATAVDSDSGHNAWQVIGKYNYQGRSLPVLNWDGVARQLGDVFGAMKEQGFYPGRDGELEHQTRWLRDEYLRLPAADESAALDDLWGIPASQLPDDNNSGQIRSIIEMAATYETEMRQHKAMRLIDQKARAAQGMHCSPEALEQLRTTFDEIIVDECQDISRLDAMLIHSTVGPQTRVVLAGDDDQTLYEWRNAHSLYLRRPDIVFGNLEFETIHLNLNYRSPQDILDPAIRLISHNVERIEKSPKSAVTHPGSMLVVPVDSPRAIDTHLEDAIREEIKNGRRPDEIAVLCHNRTEREQKIPIENMLRRAGIPVMEVDWQERPTKPGVCVRTFQRAKGRQWPVVFIPAANDRDMPDNETIRKGEVESIRRRFYVAMTRASRKLVLSYVRGGDVDRIDFTAEGDVVSTNGASRFLFEAGVVQAAPEPVAEPVVEVATPDAPQAPPAVDEAEKHKPQSVDTSVPVATPESRTEPVEVKPAAPSPAPPPVKKGRLKDWEPRADDTRKLVKARSEWEVGDFDTAILCAWKPLESALRRMVKFPPAEKSADMIAVIDEALVQRIIDAPWKDNLHLWRQVRNQAFHDDHKKSRFTPAQFKDYGFQMVDGAAEFFVHLAERNAPKQLVLETQDEFLTKLTNLVTLIQLDKPSPIKKRPIRAIRFDPDQNQFEVLAMQLLMVLRDVRFYVPEEYRWSTSPIIGQFAVGAVGHLPANMRPGGKNRLRLQPGEQMNQLMARFERMVQQECGDANPALYIRQRLEDGLLLENGNFHAGLKLNPRAKV